MYKFLKSKIPGDSPWDNPLTVNGNVVVLNAPSKYCAMLMQLFKHVHAMSSCLLNSNNPYDLVMPCIVVHKLAWYPDGSP